MCRAGRHLRRAHLCACPPERRGLCESLTNRTNPVDPWPPCPALPRTHRYSGLSPMTRRQLLIIVGPFAVCFMRRIHNLPYISTRYDPTAADDHPPLKAALAPISRIRSSVGSVKYVSIHCPQPSPLGLGPRIPDEAFFPRPSSSAQSNSMSVVKSSMQKHA